MTAFVVAVGGRNEEVSPASWAMDFNLLYYVNTIYDDGERIKNNVY